MQDDKKMATSVYMSKVQFMWLVRSLPLHFYSGLGDTINQAPFRAHDISMKPKKICSFSFTPDRV